MARLQEERGRPVNPGVPTRSPALWEREQLGEPRARGERSQQIREKSQLSVHGREQQPQGSAGTGPGGKQTPQKEAQRHFAANQGFTRRS